MLFLYPLVSPQTSGTSAIIRICLVPAIADRKGFDNCGIPHTENFTTMLEEKCKKHNCNGEKHMSVNVAAESVVYVAQFLGQLYTL